MKQRVLYLDISRSLAILLVVVGHLIQYNLTGENARVLFNFYLLLSYATFYVSKRVCCFP